jgi:hypothetical protein
VQMTEDPFNWDKHIPRVLLGYTSRAQTFTKYSPFFLLHRHRTVLPLGHRHRANVVPLYDDVSTDSELTKQAERLAALEVEARASILQAQETQKLTYSRHQLHGSVGKENQTKLGTRPFGGLTAAQCIIHRLLCCIYIHLRLPIHELERPLIAPMGSIITNLLPDATVTKLQAEKLLQLQSENWTSKYQCQRRALQSLHMLQLLDLRQQPRLPLNKPMVRLHHQSELQSTRQLTKNRQPRHIHEGDSVVVKVH